MLMTVLKGDLATEQSKVLIRTFKEMKDFIVDNRYLGTGRRQNILTAALFDEELLLLHWCF